MTVTTSFMFIQEKQHLSKFSNKDHLRRIVIDSSSIINMNLAHVLGMTTDDILVHMDLRDSSMAFLWCCYECSAIIGNAHAPECSHP